MFKKALLLTTILLSHPVMASSQLEEDTVKKTIIVQYINPTQIKFEGRGLKSNDFYPFETPAGSLRVLISQQTNNKQKIVSLNIAPMSSKKLNINMNASRARSLEKNPNGLIVEAFLNTGNPKYVSSVCIKDVPLESTISFRVIRANANLYELMWEYK